MGKVTILKGLPASGKSTWAKEQVERTGNSVRVNKDDLREMAFQSKFTKKRESFILESRNHMILSAMDLNLNPIVDDTNLNPVHEENIRSLVKLWNSEKDKGQYTVEINDSFLDVSPEECIRRDRNRANPVGDSVIRDMYNRWIKGTDLDRNKYADPPDWVFGAPTAIICDIDGTVALHTGRSPYDGSRVLEDRVNVPVASIVKRYAEKGHKILFVSGRDSGEGFSTRKLTEEWLDNWGFFDYSLYMRSYCDSRKDSVVKEEIYRNHIEGKYNILFVLDDRNQTVEKWRSLGLTCLQVASGNF